MILSLLTACLTQPSETLAQEDPQALYEAGVAALKAKEAEEAEAKLSACVAAAPQMVECHWELGWSHWLQGDWDATVRAWASSCSSASRSTWLWLEAWGSGSGGKGWTGACCWLRLSIHPAMAPKSNEARTSSRVIPCILIPVWSHSS